MQWLLPILLSVQEPAPAERRPELELTWDAPASCPAQEVVLEQIQGSLGRPLREGEDPPVQVEARVREDDGSLTLSLRTRTAEGFSERELSGSTCGVLVDAAALVIATALDPSLAFGPEPEPEPEPEPIPEQEPAPRCILSELPLSIETIPETETDPESELAGIVRVAGTGSVGPLPSIAPGFEIAAGLLRRRVRLELGFDYFFARRVASAASDTQGGEIQLWTVGTRACFAPAVSILEFPVCGGIQAGPMRGEGYGLRTPSSTRLPWIAAEAGGALVIRGLPLVDVWIGADVVLPLTRPGFFIDDLGPVHRSSSIGGEAAAGLEVRFGPGRRHPHNG